MRYNIDNMKTLILAGFSIRNKKWANELNEYLVENSIVHEWKHWQTGDEKDFSPYNEAKDVAEKIGTDEVQIIAHSAGTIITSLLLQKMAKQIKKVVLCGTPLKNFDQEAKDLFTKVLQTYPLEQILFYQNSQDPHGSYLELESFIHTINSEFKLIQKESNDHNYFHFEEFKEFLSN